MTNKSDFERETVGSRSNNSDMLKRIFAIAELIAESVSQESEESSPPDDKTDEKSQR